jgi:tRNA 5-methylaminomethyl-2-thiouridine biosynthesis bifunctional protein
LWRAHRPTGAVLHVHTIEAAPLSQAAAAAALSTFPEIAPLAAQLLRRWPVRAYGPQRLWFPEDGFCLTVWHGPVADVLPGWRGPVDAWFLDGFAPARNPEMWTPEVFAHLARCSSPGARVATYSVAGVVRRGLAAAGFEVSRVPGFAGKRERLVARLTHPPPPRFSLYPSGNGSPDGPVAVVGAGIAGAATAAALIRRGRAVTVLDRAGGPAEGASGNPLGLIMPRLDRGDTAAAAFFRASYLAALDGYGPLGPAVFDPIGVEQRPTTPAEAAALADLAADPPLPAGLLRAHGPGLFHAGAGVLRPGAAVRALLAGADLRTRIAVEGARWDPEGWWLDTGKGPPLGPFAAVVLAGGPGLVRWPQTAWLPWQATAGQVDWGSVAPSARPGHAVAAGPYVAPFDGGVLFGATFDRLTDAGDVPAPSASASARNRAALATLDQDLATRVVATGARTAVRLAVPDRLPVAGLLPDVPEWRSRFAGLAQGRPLDHSRPAPALAGLYVVGGLGARGLVTAPLLGELVAADITGEVPPISATLSEAVHPARFLARHLKRSGQRKQS